MDGLRENTSFRRPLKVSIVVEILHQEVVCSRLLEPVVKGKKSEVRAVTNGIKDTTVKAESKPSM